MAYIQFDATQVEPQTEFTPIPPGWYQVAIIESEMKETKAGTGTYLLLTMQVLDGEHKGRMVFDRINLENPSQSAVKIGRQAFSAICHAVGVTQLTDTQQIHGIPLEVKVKITPETDRYQAGNEIKGYRPVSGMIAQQPANTAMPHQPAPQQPANTATPQQPSQQHPTPQHPTPQQPAPQQSAPQQTLPQPPW